MLRSLQGQREFWFWHSITGTYFFVINDQKLGGWKQLFYYAPDSVGQEFQQGSTGKFFGFLE